MLGLNLEIFSLSKAGLLLSGPLVAAFAVDYFFSKNENSIQRLRRFSPSVRRDIIFWSIYTFGIGAILVRYMPPSLLKSWLAPYVKASIPIMKMLPSFGGKAILAAILALLLHDLATYIAHRAMHKYPFLWKFHAIHHSASEMCIFTGLRQAFTEKAFNQLLILFIALPLGLSVKQAVVVVVIRRFIDVVQHSNLGWTYGPLGYIFASPVHHYYHHSAIQEDYDSNYANVFSFWDYLFKSENSKMHTINKSLVHNELPKIGLHPGVEPFENSKYSLPLVQDVAICVDFCTQWVKNFKSLKPQNA